MGLTRTLVKDFAKITNDSSGREATNDYVHGTTKVVGDKKFVQIDGSTSLTPITNVVEVEDGDRVLVSIENHTATILGNFTFPPDARKEQEALDKAENATDTANSASTKAQEASEKAENAITGSSEASAMASEAKQSATEAIEAATNAATSATEAKQSATEASTNANIARQEAADAKANVANAQDEIDIIQNEVVTVKGDIANTLTELNSQTTAIKETMSAEYSKKTEVAQIQADLTTEISKSVGELETTITENYYAKTDIIEIEGKLQSQITQNAEGLTSSATKIEKLESDTAAAQIQVNEALTKAQAANTAAAAAQTNAADAVTAADQAKANADIASQKATTAQTTADAAKAVADTADKAVQSAQSDLNEAKQNLSSVTNRVDATEQEIADAQTKVNAAQASVNQALEDVATATYAAGQAQTAADKAQADATEANTAATNAQKKADSASLAASNAQAAADKAQADVAALTKRVTTAETNISQNAENITLNATKTEEIGDKLLNDYYSKTEADAAISVSADNIKSTVNETIKTEIDKVQVGGRNLFGGYDDGEITLETYQSGGSFSEFTNLTFDPAEYLNEEFTVSFYAKSPNGLTSLRIGNANNNPRYFYFLVDVDTSLGNEWKYYTVTFINKDRGSTYTPSTKIEMFAKSQTGVLVKKIKIERGNKATDWTPAPEDVEEDYNSKFDGVNDSISDVVQDYSSSIDQMKDSITLAVSEKYYSKTETETIINDVSTELKQTAEAIDILFTNYGEKITDVADDAKNEIIERKSLIRFVDGHIIIGVEGNEISLVQKNDRISFVQNGTLEVAYFSNSKLYVTDAEFLGSLQIGKFAYVPRANGSLDFKKVGG